MARNERFSESEVGLSHPTRSIAVRLTDDGQVLIQAGNHAGIVIDEETGVVTIFGSEIRFYAGEMRYNGAPVATASKEPFLKKGTTGELIRKIDGSGR